MTNIRLNIIDSREDLLKQKDNLIILIYKSGAPFDNEAKKLKPIYYHNSKI